MKNLRAILYLPPKVLCGLLGLSACLIGSDRLDAWAMRRMESLERRERGEKP
ncbi:MAG TPA: hypothetical protein VIK53_19475 [Verrucomicrobiae bacterium]